MWSIYYYIIILILLSMSDSNDSLFLKYCSSSGSKTPPIFYAWSIVSYSIFFCTQYNYFNK